MKIIVRDIRERQERFFGSADWVRCFQITLISDNGNEFVMRSIYPAVTPSAQATATFEAHKLSSHLGIPLGGITPEQVKRADEILAAQLLFNAKQHPEFLPKAL